MTQVKFLVLIDFLGMGVTRRDEALDALIESATTDAEIVSFHGKLMAAAEARGIQELIGSPPPIELNTTERALAGVGEVIPAIKAIRDRLGAVGLRDAKDAVDAYRNRLNVRVGSRELESVAVAHRQLLKDDRKL